MAGVPHQSVFQKIASEFSEIHINGAQLRRYTQGSNINDKFIKQKYCK
jgi:hypothetical protein